MTDSNPEQLSVASEEEPCVAPESSTPALRYPQLLLETSFASLLTHSYPSGPASSTGMDAPPRDPATLGESWASISDAESSLDDDLQSDHTDLGSLVDIHSTGDVQSIRDDDTSSDAEPDDLDELPEQPQNSAVLQPVQTPKNASELAPSISEDAQLTLDEPNAGESIVASKTVKRFSQDELRYWNLPVGVSLVGKMRMPVGKEFIRDAGQPEMRMVLFCQEAASEYEVAVLHKIGDAQLASESGVQYQSPPSTSKYHVVPDSFGPGSQPTTAAILPVDIQLDSTHYATARFESSSSRTILLGSPDHPRRTVSKWTQDGPNPTGSYVISGCQLGDPDLAVVIIGDLSEAKNREFARASLAFARRHNVPAIAVRVQNDWVSDPALAAFITGGLHLTVQDPSGSDDTIVRTLPITFDDMFWNLDACQLSRHIHHLTQRRSDNIKIRQVIAKAPEKAHVDIEKNLGDEYTVGGHVEKQSSLKLKFGRWLHVLLLALCGMIVLQGLTAVKTRDSSKSEVADSSLPLEAVVALTNSPSQISSSIKVQVATVSKDLVVATAVPRSSPTDSSRARKKLEVEVVGDSNLVIRTAREYNNAESLEVLVTRNGRTLQADVRVLFPSVWSVRLEAEQAYGELYVRLLAKRPAMNETVAVNLGQQPSSAWNFKNILDDAEAKIVQKLALLQDTLEHLQPQERPQNVVRDAQARMAWLMQQVETAVQSRAWLARTSMVQQAAQRHTKAYAQSINKRVNKLKSQLEQLRHLKVTARKRLPPQLESIMHRMRAGFHDVHFRDHVKKIWGRVQEGPQSDTLATAQKRAQHVIGGLRERLIKR